MHTNSASSIRELFSRVPIGQTGRALGPRSSSRAERRVGARSSSRTWKAEPLPSP